MHVNIFKIYTCIYKYIINMQSRTHILCNPKLLFWMRLIAINLITYSSCGNSKLFTALEFRDTCVYLAHISTHKTLIKDIAIM